MAAIVAAAKAQTLADADAMRGIIELDARWPEGKPGRSNIFRMPGF
jgi:hypothetical protein